MHPTLSKIRFEMARWSFVLGAALLVYCGVLLLVLWRTAAADGMIPERWGEYHGNHGPWRYYYVGRGLVWDAILMPFYSGFAALFSVLVKPNFRAGILLFVCVVVFLWVAQIHFWLVD